MRLHATYIQSFNFVYGVATEVEFSFKQIYKKKPHHKLLVRPSLVMGYCHGTDVTEDNNTFVFNSVTYTIPTANYTLATLATALGLLTTPQLWSSSSGKLQLAGVSVSSIFSACANSAYNLMGFVEGFDYAGTNVLLTYDANFNIQSNVNLKMPEFQSKCGHTLLSTSATGVATTSNIQGKYLVASQVNNVTLDNEQPSGSFLMSDLPIVPFKVAMEQSDGTPMTGTNHIFYNIVFTIMEVDCDIERPIKHKVVSSYIRTMTFGTTVSSTYTLNSNSFLGLFKKKPSNKWLIFNANTNLQDGNTTSIFLIMTHPNLTSKTNITRNTSTGDFINNNHILIANQTTGYANSQMNQYMLVDDFIKPNFDIFSGVVTTSSGSRDWDTTLNIFEVEYN